LRVAGKTSASHRKSCRLAVLSRFSPITVRPNRNTIGLIAVLAAMWYAGAGQSNGAAYLLCFALAALAAVSVVHTWANLRGLTLQAGAIRAVFAGEQLAVPVRVRADPGRRIAGLHLLSPGNHTTAFAGEVTSTVPAEAVLRVEARRRGCFDGMEVRATSLYPLGFFSAQRKFTLAQRYFIYPKPGGNLPLPIARNPTREAKVGARVEGDDFVGVRDWQTGESMRHVDWKAVARGQRLLVKQWRGGSGDLLVLDWDSLPQFSVEQRLSQLTRWTILAERGGANYGLRLPSQVIEPSCGEAHLHTCLRALASFEPEHRNGKESAG
jgi:uncharacterized protein (DUF58 family)